MNDGGCVIELKTPFDLECHFYREALLALECNYDAANIASMHPKVQELVRKLKEEVK